MSSQQSIHRGQENYFPNHPFRWFIADTHFGHAAMLKYEPMRKAWGTTAVEVDNAMIEAWNRIVQPDDHVLHLGDFSFGSTEAFAAFRRALHGYVVLLRGNHDRGPRASELAGFTQFRTIQFEDPVIGKVICRHNPMKFTTPEIEQADTLLCGHLHSSVHRGYPGELQQKLRCLSIEVLPSAPGPLSLAELRTLAPGGAVDTSAFPKVTG